MASGPTEKEWQATLVAALEVFGYVVEHTYPLLTKQGIWRTGSTLKGKPDLIALRPPRLLAIEVKTDRGRLEEAQRAVLSLYALIPNARAWVLRPRDDWSLIQAWMRDPKTAPRVHGFDPVDQLTAYRQVATPRQRGPR
jgi:hypothetical protein